MSVKYRININKWSYRIIDYIYVGNKYKMTIVLWSSYYYIFEN